MLSLILLSMDDTTLHSRCNQAFDLWEQLELASELESDQWQAGQEVVC